MVQLRPYQDQGQNKCSGRKGNCQEKCSGIHWRSYRAEIGDAGQTSIISSAPSQIWPLWGRVQEKTSSEKDHVTAFCEISCSLIRLTLSHLIESQSIMFGTTQIQPNIQVTPFLWSSTHVAFSRKSWKTACHYKQHGWSQIWADC